MIDEYFKWIFKPIIFQISKKSISMNLKKKKRFLWFFSSSDR